MTTHVKVLGWLFIVFGVFYVILAFGSSMVMGILASFVASQGEPDAAIGASILGLTGGAFLSSGCVWAFPASSPARACSTSSRGRVSWPSSCQPSA